MSSSSTTTAGQRKRSTLEWEEYQPLSTAIMPKGTSSTVFIRNLYWSDGTYTPIEGDSTSEIPKTRTVEFDLSNNNPVVIEVDVNYVKSTKGSPKPKFMFQVLLNDTLVSSWTSVVLHRCSSRGSCHSSKLSASHFLLNTRGHWEPTNIKESEESTSTLLSTFSKHPLLNSSRSISDPLLDDEYDDEESRTEPFNHSETGSPNQISTSSASSSIVYSPSSSSLMKPTSLFMPSSMTPSSPSSYSEENDPKLSQLLLSSPISSSHFPSCPSEQSHFSTFAPASMVTMYYPSLDESSSSSSSSSSSPSSSSKSEFPAYFESPIYSTCPSSSSSNNGNPHFYDSYSYSANNYESMPSVFADLFDSQSCLFSLYDNYA